MLVDWVDIFAIVTTVQLLLLTIFLVNHRSGKKTSNKILALFLVANALFIGDFLQIHLRLYPAFPHLLLAGYSFIYLFGPLLYVYTKSLTTPDFTLKKADLLHALPFLAYATYLIFGFYVKDAETKLRLFSGGEINTISHQLTFFDIGYLQILIYLVAALLILRRFRAELKNFYSEIESRNLSWLRLVLMGFTLMWLCDVFNAFLVRIPDTPQELYDAVLLLSVFINFTFANVAVYWSLKQPEIFADIPAESRPQAKYRSSTLTREQRDEYLKSLTNYMTKRKPYLDAALTLPCLAEQLAIPPRELSQVINESLHQNFFEFVNRYRIEEAQRLLCQTSGEKRTVLEILYEVGFNSKSAFNTAFKKHTGMTPTAFRRANGKRSSSKSKSCSST